MKKLLLLSILLFTTLVSKAQYQNHIWYFGNSPSGGINFDNTTNEPSALNTHYTPFGAEGCFVATNPTTGELMFYTSGNTIVNKNHVPMQNGELVFPDPAPIVQPDGGIFNTSVNGAQSVAVIEKPNALATGDCGKFLYFINDANEYGASEKPGSIYIGEIDMNANGGLGAVTQQPVRILTNSFTESMFVIARPDNQGAWLILNNVLTNSMEVYSISSAGTINTTPVSTYVLPGVDWSTLWTANNNVFYWLLGSMAYNEKTGKFAMSMGYAGGYNLYLSDFNSTTGALSGTTNPVRFGAPNIYVAYSTEFSPSGNWLYFSLNSASNIPATGAIRAFNMQTNTDIGNINGVGGVGWPGLQYNGLKAGPDGRLWINTNNYGTDPTPARAVRSTFNIENPVVNGFESFPLASDTKSYRFPDFLSLTPSPITVNDQVTAITNCIETAVTSSVLDNDVNPGAGNLFVERIIGTPAHGTAEVVGGQIIYTLTDLNFVGNEEVNYLIRSDASCLAPGTIGTLNIPVTNCQLPVTLTHFTATSENETANLAWATTMETNSDRFEVERSLTGKNWSKIGTVASHGESSVLHNYSFVDKQAESGENLYRLRMVDKDGTSAYSRIRSLTFDFNLGIIAYPNPVTERLLIKNFEKVKQISILNSAGLQIFQSTKTSADGIDIKKLVPGVYILNITLFDGTQSTHKIVVAK